MYRDGHGKMWTEDDFRVGRVEEWARAAIEANGWDQPGDKVVPCKAGDFVLETNSLGTSYITLSDAYMKENGTPEKVCMRTLDIVPQGVIDAKGDRWYVGIAQIFYTNPVTGNIEYSTWNPEFGGGKIIGGASVTSIHIEANTTTFGFNESNKQMPVLMETNTKYSVPPSPAELTDELYKFNYKYLSGPEQPLREALLEAMVKLGKPPKGLANVKIYLPVSASVPLNSSGN